MNKRNLATVLWFAMGWTIGSMAAVVVGLPTILGAFMGIPFALAVRSQPARRMWSPDALAAKHTTKLTSGPAVTE